MEPLNLKDDAEQSSDNKGKKPVSAIVEEFEAMIGGDRSQASTANQQGETAETSDNKGMKPVSEIVEEDEDSDEILEKDEETLDNKMAITYPVHTSGDIHINVSAANHVFISSQVAVTGNQQQQLQIVAAKEKKKPRNLKTMKIVRSVFFCYLLIFLYEAASSLPPSDPMLPASWQIVVLIAAGFGILVSVYEFWYDQTELGETKIFGFLAAVIANCIVFVAYFAKENQSLYGMFTLGMATVIVTNRLDELLKHHDPSK